MVEMGYLVIVAIFLAYYVLVLIFERELIQDPKDIIDGFLSVALLYAGVSLIYFSFTGTPLFNDSPQTYNIYIFVIGFIAVLWTGPHLLERFRFFRQFMEKKTVHQKVPIKKKSKKQWATTS